jgi:CRISPR-associated protein Cas1
VEDIGMLILEHPSISLTQQLVVELLGNNAVIVWCDAQHLPFGILHPLHSHSLIGKRLNAQASLTDRVKNRLWKQIIRAKIQNQAILLQHAKGHEEGLAAMVNRVKSGDPSNVEARAARTYWKELFGETGFKRGREEGHVNPFLNYGYTILRAACCRALVGTGLHPGLGINHSNQYNPFPLADDVMEPLRPLVDHIVYESSEAGKDVPDLDKENRKRILESLSQPILVKKKSYPLMEGLAIYAASLSACMLGEQDALNEPQLVL